MPRGAGLRKKGTAYEPQAVDKTLIAKAMGIDPEGEPDVFKFLSRALDFPLPEPWTEHADKKGRIFYWNPASRHSSWAHPLASTHKQLVNAFRRVSKAKLAGEDPQALVLAEIEEFHRQGEEEINQWRVSHAPDGTPYYYKTGTQQTRWDNPRDELVSHQELRIQMLSQLLEPESEEAPEEERHRAIHHEQSQVPVECTQVPALLMGSEAPRFRANCPDCGSLNEFYAGRDEIFEVNCALQTCKLRFQVRNVVTTTPALSVCDGPLGSRENSRGDLDPKRSLRADFDKAARSTTSSMFGSQSQGLGSARSNKDMPGVSPIPSPSYSALSTPGLGMKVPQSRESSLDRSGRMNALSRALVTDGPESSEFLSRGTSREGSRPMSGIPFDDAVDSPGPSRLATVREQVIVRRGGDGTKSLYDGTDVDWIDPEQIALRLGLNFADDVERASFHILKPIFTMPLPAPWRGFRRKTGRTDFYHPGSAEHRTSHPMMGFFKELLQFLREQSVLDTDMFGPLSAMVFKEASPQSMRQRLGIWEGPYEVVAGTTGGATTYERLLPGTDEACIEEDSRRDDPRVEAAANAMTRFDAWFHLWNGFCPDEPFPFSENRIPALVSQLCESVVIAPGDRADKETVLHQWNWDLERRSDKVPQMEEPLLPEEEAVQHEVTALLGAAYGVALSVVAAHDAPYASNKAITLVVRKSVFRAVANRDFKAELVPVEEEETYEEDENEDEFEEESEGERLSESGLDEASRLEQSISETDLARQSALDKQDDEYSDSEFPDSPESKRHQTNQSLNLDDMAVDLGAEADDEEMDDSKIIASDDVGLFLNLDEDPDEWAEFALRPLTPRETIDTQVTRDIRSPPASMMQRPKGFDEDVWATRNFLKGAVVKPFVSDLGWRCHLEITKGMWTEGETEPTTVIDTALATSPWLVEAALSPSGQVPSPKTTFTASPRSTQGGTQTLGFTEQSVPPTPSQYRGIPLPPVALEQIRDSNQAEVKTFRDRLNESATLFEKCLVQRQESGTRPSTPLVAPYEDIAKQEDVLYPKPRSKYLMEKEAAPRKNLQRANLPIREKVSGGSMYDMPCAGCVPPAPSPPSCPRGGFPRPPYLQGTLKKNVWGLRCERPRSAERLPKEGRSLKMHVGPRAHSADARARKARTNLLPEDKDIGAQMAVEQINFFLSRKYGTIEAAFKALDNGGKGFISMQDWVDGLQRMEYERMEYAQGMFKILDTRQHYVLTLSDLGRRAGKGIYDGFPESALSSEFADIFEDVLAEELEGVVKDALGEIMLAALRHPQPPIPELAVQDFTGWLKSKAKKKPKAKAKKQSNGEEEQGLGSDVDADLLNSLGVDSEGSDSTKNKRKTVSKMPRPGGGESSGSEKSSRKSSKSPGGRSPGSPGTGRRATTKKKSKPKVSIRSMGMLGKLLKDAGEDNETIDPSQEDQETTGKPVSKPETTGKPVSKPKSKSSKGGLKPGKQREGRSSSKDSESNRSTSDRSGSSRKGSRSLIKKGKLKMAGLLAGKSGKRTNSESTNETRLVGKPKKGPGLSPRPGKGRGLSPRPGMSPGSAREQGRSPGRSPRPTKHGTSLSPGSTDQSFRSSGKRGGTLSPGSTGQSFRSSGKRGSSRQSPRPDGGSDQSKKRGGTLSPGSTGQSFRSSGKRGSSRQSLRPDGGSDPSKKQHSVSKKSLRTSSVSDSSRSRSPKDTQKPDIQVKPIKRASYTSKVQIGGSKSSSVPRRRKQPNEQVPGAILSTRLGPAPIMTGAPGKGHRTKQKPQSFSDSEMIPNYGNADFSHQDIEGGLGLFQRRAPTSTRQPSSGYPSTMPGPSPSYDVGFHQPGGYPQPRPPSELLPWCPRGPDEVCKTYSHIFKLLNDPQLKKKLPKPKLSLHVKLPSIAGSSSQPPSACDEDDFASLSELRAGSLRTGVIGSSSAPDLHSGVHMDVGMGQRGHPLAKSASSKAYGGLLTGGMVTTVVSH